MTQKLPLLDQLYSKLEILRRANALVQHHDGITGTERPHVIQMYRDYIMQGVEAVKQVESLSLSSLVGSSSDLNLTRKTSVLQAMLIPVIIYNNLGWYRSEYVSVYIKQPMIIVDEDNQPLQNQLLGRRHDYFELYFETGMIPAMGFVTFFLKSSSMEKQLQKVNDLSLSNDIYHITFDNNLNIKTMTISSYYQASTSIFTIFEL
jgi:uncharacterized membrane protein